MDQSMAQLHTEVSLPTPNAATVLQLCDKVQSGDPYTMHCKVVALIRQQRYASAIPLAESLLQKLVSGKASSTSLTGRPAPSAVRFALAYCYYRQQHMAKALELLKQQQTEGAPDAASLNLKAQCEYNLEQFAEAAETYEGMLRDGLHRDDVERSEILTNLTAAYSQLDYGKCREASERCEASGNATFDCIFNHATGAVHNKDYLVARSLLERAVEQCLQEHGVDPATDVIAFLGQYAAAKDKRLSEGVVRDVAPVLAQQAYVLAATGDEAAATKLLQPLLELEGTLTTATFAAVCVNWAAIKKEADFLETYKRLKHVQQRAVAAKLTSRQRLYVQYNAVLLLLRTGSGIEECRRLAAQMVSGSGSDSVDSDLGPLAFTAVLAASHKGSTSQRAENHFKAFLARHGGVDNADRTARLTLAQLGLERGNLAVALERLQGDVDLLGSSPAALATVVHACATRSGDVDTAIAVLHSVRDRYDTETQPRELRLAYWRFTADVCSALHQHGPAVEAYERLLALAPADHPCRPYWVTEIVRSAARSGCSRAQVLQFASQLPPSRSVAATEAAASPPVAQIAAAGIKRQQTAATEGAKGAVLIKPARCRPLRRVPAKVRAGEKVPPIDRERWVPIKERTYIRDLPARRQRELKRRRAQEHDERRRQKRREAAAALAAAVAETK